jgi:hypothetical protein
MKKGVVLYHCNIEKIYKKRWINECIDSLINQTDTDFIFYEVNYGGSEYSVLSDSKISQEIKFWSCNLSNYAEAMNFIIEKAFDDSCDAVFNVNLDDKYHPERIEKEFNFIKLGYDLITSDFCYIEEDSSGEDSITNLMLMSSKYPNINSELEKNHNVIAHPCVCYSRKFWDFGNRYDINKTPEEDLDLWKKTINSGLKFLIIPEILLYYRIHKNQSSNKEK